MKDNILECQTSIVQMEETKVCMKCESTDNRHMGNLSDVNPVTESINSLVLVLNTFIFLYIFV